MELVQSRNRQEVVHLPSGGPNISRWLLLGSHPRLRSISHVGRDPLTAVTLKPAAGTGNRQAVPVTDQIFVAGTSLADGQACHAPYPRTDPRTDDAAHFRRPDVGDLSANLGPAKQANAGGMRRHRLRTFGPGG